MKKIPLSIYKKNPKLKGYFAIVDDEDYEALSKYHWAAVKTPSGVLYAVRSTPRDENGKQKHIYMHNEIMGEKWIDHKDRNGLNNLRSNLRKCTPKENSANRKPKPNKDSGYIGVCKATSGKFRAKIKIDGKVLNLGTSMDKKECARWYNEAALKFRGEFAHLNKID